MKIDLLALAKQVEETYKDVELEGIGTVRVYHTPEPMIWTYRPDRPEPIQPMIQMKLATGGRQNRVMKEGDKGWEEWQKDYAAYENELTDIRLAARYVLALRDIEYPDTSQPPPIAAMFLNGNYPVHPILRKKLWLDHSLFAHARNLTQINLAMIELGGGTNANNVDEIKKNSELKSEESE
jgi:hypothetical protein